MLVLVPASHLERTHLDILLGKLELSQKLLEVLNDFLIFPLADLSAGVGGHKKAQDVSVLFLHDEGYRVSVVLVLLLGDKVDIAFPLAPERFLETDEHLVYDSVSHPVEVSFVLFRQDRAKFYLASLKNSQRQT